MTDLPNTIPPAPPKATDAQLIVALVVASILGALGLGLIAAGLICVWNGKSEPAIWLGVGAVIGALSAALSAPTGVANALRAAGKDKGAPDVA